MKTQLFLGLMLSFSGIMLGMDVPETKPSLLGEAQLSLNEVIPYMHPGWSEEQFNELLSSGDTLFSQAPEDIHSCVREFVFNDAEKERVEINAWLKKNAQETKQEAFRKMIKKPQGLSSASRGILVHFFARHVNLDRPLKASYSTEKTPLMHAASDKDLIVLQALIACNAYLDARCEGGKTALRYALESGFAKGITALADANADLTVPDSLGQTVFNGQPCISRCSVQLAFDTNDPQLYVVSGPSGEKLESKNIIRYSCGREVIDALNDTQFNPRLRFLFNTQNDEFQDRIKEIADSSIPTVASWGIRHGCIEKVLEIEKSRTIKPSTITSIFQNSLLLEAVQHQREQLVQHWLLQATKETKETLDHQNVIGETVLILAAEQGNASLVTSFVQAGADLNKTDNDGNTALQRALRNKHADIARLLIEAGADVNCANNWGHTPYLEAVDANDLAMLELLHSKGARLDMQLEKKEYIHTKINMVFHRCCSKVRSVEVLQFLLEHGGKAHINEQDEGDVYKATPLHKVCHKPDLVSVLLDNGAQVNLCDSVTKGASSNSVKGKGVTPLSYAAFQANVAVIKLLIDNGADVNSQSEHDKMTPLHEAVHQCYVSEKADRFEEFYQTIELLLQAGADLHAKDDNNESPLGITNKPYFFYNDSQKKQRVQGLFAQYTKPH